MNYYDIKASQVEGRLLRRWVERNRYVTGSGNEQVIVAVDQQRIYFQTSSTNRQHVIIREKLRKAIALLLHRKTVLRKELERFSHMNSSLMGLLRHLFIETAKFVRTKMGQLRLTIKGCRFFFSGLERASRKELECLRIAGAKHILASYFYLRGSLSTPPLLRFIEGNECDLLLDSGEFSSYKARMKYGDDVSVITVEEYAEFIRTYDHLIYAFFNLDVTGDPVLSAANFDKLRSLTGRNPIPVWHPNLDDWRNSDFSELERLVNEDHAVIAIGGTVHLGLKVGPLMSNKVKAALFHEIYSRFGDSQNFHWLGGSSRFMHRFPFFSADSSGYLQARKFQQRYYFDGEDIATRQDQELSAWELLLENVRLFSNLERDTNPMLYGEEETGEFVVL
ncbi:hypothetical protein [Paenibacillus sp. GXUN7292]|uniref:hypothetical protein n=1 Tax=Paenibacillus sp. GXUN7292 TaxID=3422499 RepID=UPI003D7C87DA